MLPFGGWEGANKRCLGEVILGHGGIGADGTDGDDVGLEPEVAGTPLRVPNRRNRSQYIM